MSTTLEPRFIVETAERLRKRISERFPGSGLLGVAILKGRSGAAPS